MTDDPFRPVPRRRPEPRKAEPRKTEPRRSEPRPVRPRARRVNQHDLRDIRARLRGTIYEKVEPQAGIGGDLYSAPQIVDFCLDLGEVMLASGADVRSTEVAIVAVATKWNLAPLELDITGTAITLQYAPPGQHPLTKVRVIHAEGSNLYRLNQVYVIVNDLVDGDLDMTDAVAGLVDVVGSPSRWSPWIMDLGLGLLAASVCLQAGGSTFPAIGALLVVLGISLGGRWLLRRGIPTFFVSGGQAAVATVAGSIAIFSGLLPAGGAAAMVAASVVVLLPHPVLVTWAQDAISGFRSMALSRGLIIALTIGSIVCGVPAGIAITSGLSIEVDPANISLQTLPLWLLLISSVLAAGANCFVWGASARVIPIAMGASLLSALVLHGLMMLGDVPRLGSTFLAATVLGALSTVIAVRLRTSPAVIAVPAFCGSLLPGLAVSSALLDFMAGAPGASLAFVAAVLVALGIGAGLVLGNLIAAPGARRYLRRSKRVEVHSVNTETRSLDVITSLAPPPA